MNDSRATAEAAVSTFHERGLMAKILAMDDQLLAQVTEIAPQLRAINKLILDMGEELRGLSGGDGWIMEVIEVQYLRRAVLDPEELAQVMDLI